VQTLREMNADNLRKVPADAPTAFIKPRWKPLVITPEGLDRKLLKLKAGSSITWLTWLRQAPLKPNSRHMLEHIERLKTFQLVD
ncbi:hypothetical protein, partial [Escherichia coli]|uniref:hypothetical protein n=1 Tax=Escherichia coli TaxID=562 RepID=UPI00227DEF18